MIGDGNANTVSILDPVLRAGEADLVIPVPSGATSIRRLGVVGSREDTSSVFKVVSLEA